MLTNDLKNINLMNPVRTSWKYNKFQNSTPEQKDHIACRDYVAFMTVLKQGKDARGYIWDGANFKYTRQISNPIVRTFVEFYVRLRVSLSYKGDNVESTFDQIKESFHVMTNEQFRDDAEFNEIIEKLEITSQTSALSQVQEQKLIQDAEKILILNGFDQYQTEQSLIKFIRQSKRGLCLKELEYFTRDIPQEVINKFQQAEALGVFDNYYVLFLDPTGAKNPYYTYTTAEKRDPILFGVIVGSDKLYFIADWIDEFCSLTYSEILKNGTDHKL